MFGFDGDYRCRPLQNLGGASQTCDRDTVIRKAQLERQKRNELRQQNNGAVVLQSYTRSFLHRQRRKRLEREAFDEFMRTHRDKLAEDENLDYLLRRMLFFYNHKDSKDGERLIDVCQFILRNPSKMLHNAVSEFIWLHRLKKLLMLCIEQLTVPNAAQAIPMRMLETFTSESVVERNIEDRTRVQRYLDNVFAILSSGNTLRVSVIYWMDGETLQAPNQVAEAIFQMILRPLIMSHRGFSYGKIICESFTKHILSVKFSEPVRNFIISFLAELSEFPFEYMIKSLHQLTREAEEASKMQVDGASGSGCAAIADERQNVEPTIFSSYLLNSLLILDRKQLARDDDACLSDVLGSGIVTAISEH